jgi:hypothetical protein
MLMKLVLLSLFVFVSIFSFAQGEEIGPLTKNLELSSKSNNFLEKSGPTFDSTFIYFSDTLGLPFFDEFSKNLFQKYDIDFSDVGVTSEEYFRLLDNVTSVPLAADQYFTAQPTFRRVYNIATSNYVDEAFTPLEVKVGDLSAYPVVYETTDLFPPFYIYDTIGAPDVSDTIWIVGPEFFQDSATQFFAQLNDPNALWLDSYAYHNYRYAFEPRTLGVVTFDGLDENGYPYLIGSSATNYADVLTSKPLDLGSLDASDSVYFSFLYQKQGFGDIPEQGDSLVLEFYAKDLDQWFRVWSVNGGTVAPFEVGHIVVLEEKYFKKGFQFRFKNFGALSGALDHFHIDYVHLRTLSGYQDTLFKDFAFVYPLGSLLKDYTSVPWDHFKNNPVDKMNDKALLVVHNGSNLAENNQNGSIEVSFLAAAEGAYVLPAQDLSGGGINYDPQTTYYSEHDLSGGYVYDITKPGNAVTFDILATASAQFPNFPDNDETTATQHFSNYYSYDDGSAEAAYGPTGAQSRLAIQYTAYEADSLIGIRMHFVPSVNDVSNKLFLLSVWDDNAGQPGEVVYEDESFFPRQPIYADGQNNFITYYFKDTMKVAVGETFYVGWRQFDADRLNIGLDRNLDNKEKTFYSVNNGFSWSTSTFEGSVMIHPIFSTGLDVELGIPEEIADEIDVNIYPNPTDRKLKIDLKGSVYKGAQVFSMDGRMVFQSEENELDLIDLDSGVYYIRLTGFDSKAYKVILAK